VKAGAPQTKILATPLFQSTPFKHMFQLSFSYALQSNSELLEYATSL
jgi:hypothetical protein